MILLFVDYNPVVILYVVGLWSVGASCLLLAKKKDFYRSHHFYLPLISLFCSTTFITIDLSIYIFPVTKHDTLEGLITTQLLLDGITSMALGMAFFLRLKFMMDTAKKTSLFNAFAYWAVNVFAIVPMLYWVVDVVGIVALYVPDFAARCNGHVTQYAFGSGNIALSINDLGTHATFVYVLLSQMKSCASKLRKRLILTTVFLSLNSMGLLTGAIWSFFNGQVGTVIAYVFWINNVFVFLILNVSINQVFKKMRTASSKSDPPTSEKESNATKASISI